MIFEADGEADVEDRIVRDLQLVGGLFQSKPIDILLRSFTHRIGEHPLEVKR